MIISRTNNTTNTIVSKKNDKTTFKEGSYIKIKGKKVLGGIGMAILVLVIGSLTKYKQETMKLFKDLPGAIHELIKFFS